MLKKRLQVVANLVAEDSLIDIGSDHGYLVIDLIKKGTIKHALVVEVAKGPLENAKENINKYNLKNVEFALSDGLKDVDIQLAHQYDSATICGMGGNLIASIIADSLPLFRHKTLYLQPNNKEYNLRKFLNANQFKIVDEAVVYDNGIYYEILKVISEEEKLTDNQLYFGPINLEKRAKSWVAKYEDQLSHLYRVKKQLITNNVDYTKIDLEIKKIEDGLNETT